MSFSNWEPLSGRFGVDFRAMAVARILFGLNTFIFFVSRLPHAEIFYSSRGLLPLDLRIRDLGRQTGRGTDGIWSTFFFSDSPTVSVFCFLFGSLAAICVATGFKTRSFTIICWILIGSVRARQPYAGDGGDGILRTMSFWAMFLPWGQILSLDSVFRNKRQERRAGKNQRFACTDRFLYFFSIGTLGFIMQLSIIYWFSALLKVDPTWRSDLTAVGSALRINSLTTPLADFIADQSSILPYLTKFVLLVEEFAPFLTILFPVTCIWRSIGPFLLIGLHIGIAFLFSFGIFPWIAISFILLLLPTPFWDLIFPRKTGLLSMGNVSTNLGRRHNNPVINYFSGLALALIIWWNAANIPGIKIDMPDQFRRISFGLFLNQNWSFFAPTVNAREGFYELQCRFTDNSETSLNWDGTNFTGIPDSLRNVFPDKQQRQFMQYLFHSRKQGFVDRYVEWVKLRAESLHGKTIDDLKVFFYLIDNRFPKDGIQKVQIFPYESVNANGICVFAGDKRRNSSGKTEGTEKQ